MAGNSLMRFLLFCFLTLTNGCSSFLPSSGPSRRQVQNSTDSKKVPGIHIVEVTDTVARKVLASKKHDLFSEAFVSSVPYNYVVGSGDALEVTIWEAPPGVLFAGLSNASTFPEQIVNSEGSINIPFAGHIKVSGITIRQIENAIERKLKGKANQPQVLVRVTRNNTSNVIVVGDVTSSMRVPLTARGERLLDALAVAGGVRQSVNKTTLQVTRGDKVQALPLDTIIRDPRQNILLRPGDVITSLYQSLTFTVLGATGKNQEVDFEAQGISLAQALARAGGLNDSRADAKGVFIFRFEKPEALSMSEEPKIKTPEGRVPVVYQVDLKDPATFFIAQNFPIENGDVMYVSNAPGAQLQKFLNMLQSTMFSAQGILNTQNSIDKTFN